LPEPAAVAAVADKATAERITASVIVRRILSSVFSPRREPNARCAARVPGMRSTLSGRMRGSRLTSLATRNTSAPARTERAIRTHGQLARVNCTATISSPARLPLVFF
jgi:hypothetical protein